MSYSPLTFRAELDRVLSFNLNYVNNDTFTRIVMELLNKHAPIKFRYLRANDKPFMTLRPMKQTRLINGKEIYAHHYCVKPRNHSLRN